VKIPPDTLNALKERAETEGPRLILTGPRFTPTLYQQVNEVLEAVGGRWTSSEGAHLFPIDADEALAPVLATGHVVTLREKRQQAQYFPTPAPIVQRLIELADIKPGMEVLEPSAGSGAIAAAVARLGTVVDCFEQDPGYAAVLADTGAPRTVRVVDFLTMPPNPIYDRVVMNPPFTRGADIRHAQHALRFLAPDGLLVSVMSWTVTEHSRNTAAFRALVEARGGVVEAVAEKAFAESGTDVPTVIVAIPAARPANVAPTAWPVREAAAQPEPELQSPAEICDEIRASLRKALTEFDAVAALFAAPAVAAQRRPAAVVHLPGPRQDQLAFDMDAAS
jgi:predicted RNA methylase